MIEETVDPCRENGRRRPSTTRTVTALPLVIETDLVDTPIETEPEAVLGRRNVLVHSILPTGPEALALQRMTMDRGHEMAGALTETVGCQRVITTETAEVMAAH